MAAVVAAQGASCRDPAGTVLYRIEIRSARELSSLTLRLWRQAPTRVIGLGPIRSLHWFSEAKDEPLSGSAARNCM